MKDFPIPVVAIGIGPGSQPEEDTLEYLPMPQGMETFRAPVLPEPEDVVGCKQAHRALREALAQLDRVRQGAGNLGVDLTGLPEADLHLINQVLGEGEVSALVTGGDSSYELRVQESVFAGVWRVVCSVNGVVSSDTIELGAVPQALRTRRSKTYRPACRAGRARCRRTCRTHRHCWPRSRTSGCRGMPASRRTS